MNLVDTTRLRALAEAVRDAGEKSAYAHHVVRRLVDAGHHDITSVRKDARAAADRLRAAQKALYAAGSPDSIILALLDELEQLRARLVRTMKCPGCDGEMAIPRDAEDGSEHRCACGKTLFLHEDDGTELRFLCDYCEGDPFDECDFCGRERLTP